TLRRTDWNPFGTPTGQGHNNDAATDPNLWGGDGWLRLRDGLVERQPFRPFLIAAACFWLTSVTKSGGASAPAGPSNSRVTNALPSVNSTTVTDLVPSGEFPDTDVPPVPTFIGAGVPPVTLWPSVPLAASRALDAAAGSARIRIVSPTTWEPS